MEKKALRPPAPGPWRRGGAQAHTVVRLPVRGPVSFQSSRRCEENCAFFVPFTLEGSLLVIDGGSDLKVKTWKILQHETYLSGLVWGSNPYVFGMGCTGAWMWADCGSVTWAGSSPPFLQMGPQLPGPHAAIIPWDGTCKLGSKCRWGCWGALNPTWLVFS